MKKLLMVMMVSVALAGCASSGNQSLKKESEASVKSKIVEGVTTKSDIKKPSDPPQRPPLLMAVKRYGLTS